MWSHLCDQHKHTKHSEISENHLTRSNTVIYCDFKLHYITPTYLVGLSTAHWPVVTTENPYDWNDGRLTSYLSICTSVLPLFHDPTLKRWRSTSQDMFFPRCSNCLWFFSWAMTSISKPYLPLRQFWTGDWIPRAWRSSGFRLFPCPVINFQDPTSLLFKVLDYEIVHFGAGPTGKKLSGTTGGQDIHVLSAREFQR